MNSYTLIVSDEILKKMAYFYKDNYTPNNNQYALFIAKTDNCVITAYKSKKVLFQGKNVQEEVNIWGNQDFSKSETIPSTNYYLESIGSDEVGTGDYFGPVVVLSCYLDNKNISLIKKYNIDDSKKLTDDYIKQIAPLLFKILPYSLLIVNNEKYNELMNDEKMNLNKLKAVLHKQAITNLLYKINLTPTIIIDQFASIDNFIKYTKDVNFTKQITFHTKAESKFASVACASIMARYIFLQEMDKLGTLVNTTLRKGASNLVNDQGKELVKIHGEQILEKLAKLHFKNTDKILK